MKLSLTVLVSKADALVPTWDCWLKLGDELYWIFAINTISLNSSVISNKNKLWLMRKKDTKIKWIMWVWILGQKSFYIKDIIGIIGTI